jgi:hypothetical protein
MNKFEVTKCVEIDEPGYKGHCVILSCASDPSFLLFFPIGKENVKTINFVLADSSKYDINTNVLGIYKTMIDSWRASDRYLSGIIMDTIYNDEMKEEILMIRLALSDSDGDIESLVHVNFLHAILLAAMEGTYIIVGDSLLSKMVADMEQPEEEIVKKKTPHFPEDKKIVDIAKKIMGGKIKDP